MVETVQNLAKTEDTLARLADAGREELAVDLAILGRDYLALQQVRAPKDTGALESELMIQAQIDQLRVRVGLVGRPSKENFIGRVIEFGRQAQTVIVQRRRVGSPKLLRRGRKRAEDIASTYALNVRARAAEPFVNVPDTDLDRIAANRIADFWSRSLAKAGA